MSEAITDFFSRWGSKIWRSGVVVGIGLILWMQAQFPTRKEFERVEKQLDRMEDKLEALQQSVSVHSALLSKRYE